MDMVGSVQRVQRFIEALGANMCQTVEQLLAARANVNAALCEKSTALHLGCYSGHTKAVELLLSTALIPTP